MVVIAIVILAQPQALLGQARTADDMLLLSGTMQNGAGIRGGEGDFEWHGR